MNTTFLSMLYLLINGSSSTIQTGNFGFRPADEVGLQFFPHFIGLQAKTLRLTKLFSGSISQENVGVGAEIKCSCYILLSHISTDDCLILIYVKNMFLSSIRLQVNLHMYIVTEGIWSSSPCHSTGKLNS